MLRIVSPLASSFQSARLLADISGVARLEKVQECVSTISSTASDGKNLGNGSDLLEGFIEGFNTLLSFKEEYRTMGLDEVVVGAIAQTVS